MKQLKQRDKFYLRIERLSFEKEAYEPEWKCVGEDRGHALARLNACKIADNVPVVKLYKIKENAEGIVLESEAVAIKDSEDGYRLLK